MTIHDVLAQLRKVQKCGGGWKACCPAHDDRNPSLFIKCGENGVRFTCYAGCRWQDVKAKLGVYDEVQSLPRQNAQGRPTFATAEECIEHVSRRLGRPHRTYEYRNADGETVSLVLRWDAISGPKTIRPIAKIEGWWTQAALPVPRIPYSLHELSRKPGLALVVEGEKCAEALRSLGFLSTTAQGGGGAAGLTDWTPLQGRQVIIIPDEDEPGRKYALEVAKLTGGRIARLPGLAQGEDVYDFIQRLPGSKWWKKRMVEEAIHAESQDANSQVGRAGSRS